MRIQRLLWLCREEIPLDESIWEDVTLQWLEERCRRRRAWIVKIEDEAVGAAVLQPVVQRYGKALWWAGARPPGPLRRSCEPYGSASTLTPPAGGDYIGTIGAPPPGAHRGPHARRARGPAASGSATAAPCPRS